jgi:hypothetical protein
MSLKGRAPFLARQCGMGTDWKGENLGLWKLERVGNSGDMRETAIIASWIRWSATVYYFR